MSDLFDESFSSKSTDEKNTPLSARTTIQNIKDFKGQKHILSPDKLLYRLIESDTLRSALFYGPPGSGKTAVAKFIAAKTNALTYQFNAAVLGVGELKKIILKADLLKKSHNKNKLLIILDEIHHFNRSQQDVLLPSVEQGEIILIGITTENPFFYVNRALLSRFSTFEFKNLTDDDLGEILENTLNYIEKDKENPKVLFEPKVKKYFASQCAGDARKLINAVELGLLTIKPKNGEIKITMTDARELIQTRSISYDKSQDEHYDHISAFIKSMRGTDPDAALYWLAKMIEAGEDLRFIARRILICASEDVGNADPVALVIAQSAFNAVEVLGMPEGRIILSQAAVYVASAPKSNACYKAIDSAIEEVKKGEPRKVPKHLMSGARGEGYLYSHDFEGHFVKQEYMPNPKQFYFPSEQGKESQIKAKLEKLNIHGTTKKSEE